MPRLLSYAAFEGRPLTTRGRWFNPVVMRHLRLARSGRLPAREVDRPVFIVGTGRSGTTLLGQLFAAHPDVGFLNEPKAIWASLRDDEDVIGSYSATPPRLRLFADDCTADVAAAAHAIYGWYLYVTRSTRVVDKYPELVFRTEFVDALFPDAQFVGIVRDPWDVMASIEAWSERHGARDGDWWGVADRKWRVLWEQAITSDPELQPLAQEYEPLAVDAVQRGAWEWLVSTRELLRAKQTLAHRLSIVRYERLQIDVRGVFARLLDDCGLSAPPRLLEFAGRQVDSGSRGRRRAVLPEALETAIATAAHEIGIVAQP